MDLPKKSAIFLHFAQKQPSPPASGQRRGHFALHPEQQHADDVFLLGGGLGAFLILLAEPGKALWFILFLLILQQVEGNLIYPKVVGKSVGLPGLLVLMAVTIGGEAFGVLGMLFSVPVCAVLYSLYLEFMKKVSTNH